MNYATHLNNAVPYGVHITAADPAECRRAQQSYEALLADPAAFPCSFALDGNRQTGFVGFEQVNRATAQQGDKRTDTLVLRRADGLECRVEAALYPRHAAYEWTLWFKNCGSADSPVLSSLNGADFVLPGKKPRLRSIMGDARNERYGTGDGTISPTYGMNNQPYDLPLALGMSYQMVNTGARSCDHEFPYFTLQMADRGTVIAVGWPGQWRAEFYADLTGVHFTDGQQKFAAALHPGEEIRTPMTTLLLYDGADAQRQTNLWRAFMMECNMPRQNGYISLPILSSSSYGTGMMTAATEQNQLEQIAFYRENGVMLDNWWMDAGWYTTDTDEGAPKVEDDYVFVGSWKIREKDFPTHLAAVSDAMHATGGTTLLWFEPERCGIEPDTLKTDGTSLKKEWLLEGYREMYRPRPDGSEVKLPVTMVNLGNPEAYQWMKNRIFTVLKEGKIDIYREDHNYRPLDFLEKTDRPGRIGMAENKYMTAHLRLWDEMRAEFGDMILDSCASGGRRNDLETLRRAVPMHFTDFFIGDLPRRQAMEYSLFQWFPFFKAECASDTVNPYCFCSGMTPMTMVYADWRNPEKTEIAKFSGYLDIWRSLNKYFYADYYPLTPWNIDEGSPIGWQFIDREVSAGFAQLIRRPMTEQSRFALRFQALQPDVTYRFTNRFTGKEQLATGTEAMENGIEVEIPDLPGAAVLQFAPVTEL